MSIFSKWYREQKIKDKLADKARVIVAQLEPEILAIVKTKLNDSESEKLTKAIIDILNQAVDKVF